VEVSLVAHATGQLESTVPVLTARRAVLTLGVAFVVAALLVPFDRELTKLLGPFRLDGFAGLGSFVGGDIKRELEFVQQFGAVTSVVISCVLVLLLDRARAARMIDIALACIATGLSQNVIKMLVGRPRPRVVFSEHALAGYDDPTRFAFAWQQYPLPRPGTESGVLWAHSWELWKGISSDLWAMPSSHTAGAFCLAACLVRLYPRIGKLVWVLAGIVAFARVLLGAHFVSDVVVGGATGFVVGALVMQMGVGARVGRGERGTGSGERASSDQ
jgi:membrane-associated phospholipid phosphatase